MLSLYYYIIRSRLLIRGLMVYLIMARYQYLLKAVKGRHSLILAVILSLFISGACALENSPDVLPSNESSGYSEYIQAIINNTPPTNPAFLDESRNNEKVIAVSGRIPSYRAGQESYDWFVLLQKVLKKINDEELLEDYQWDNGGYIIGFGCPHDYLHFYVYADADVSEEELNEIISIITKAGESYNISDIPIVVERDYPSQGFNPTDPNSLPDEMHSLPGLGIFGLLICFGLAVILLIRAK